MLDSLRSHIEDKIEAAELDRSPFPHLIIEDFFPEDVYAKIMAYNPFQQNAGQEWQSKAHSADVISRTPYYARTQINFHKNDPFEAPPEQREFWDKFNTVFLKDRWFENLVAKKYADYFSIRFGDLMEHADAFDLFKRELFLQQHKPGYYIGPHTDIPTRVFTCIFAFAEGDGYEDFGTQLLVPDDRLARCTGNDHYPFEGFQVKKLAPYKRNNFLLFFKTRQSFHAVRAIDDTVPNRRYGMQFQLYEPKGGVFNDLSAPTAMASMPTKSIVARLREKVGV